MHNSYVGEYTINHNGDWSGEMIVHGPTGSEIRIPLQVAATITGQQLVRLVGGPLAERAETVTPDQLLRDLVTDERVRTGVLTRTYGDEPDLGEPQIEGRMVYFPGTDQRVPVSVLAAATGRALAGEMGSIAEYDDSIVQGLSYGELEDIDPINLLAHLAGVMPAQLGELTHTPSDEDTAWKAERSAAEADGKSLFNWAAGVAYRDYPLDEGEADEVRATLERILTRIERRNGPAV